MMYTARSASYSREDLLFELIGQFLCSVLLFGRRCEMDKGWGTSIGVIHYSLQGLLLPFENWTECWMIGLGRIIKVMVTHAHWDGREQPSRSVRAMPAIVTRSWSLEGVISRVGFLHWESTIFSLGDHFLGSFLHTFPWALVIVGHVQWFSGAGPGSPSNIWSIGINRLFELTDFMNHVLEHGLLSGGFGGGGANGGCHGDVGVLRGCCQGSWWGAGGKSLPFALLFPLLPPSFALVQSGGKGTSEGLQITRAPTWPSPPLVISTQVTLWCEVIPFSKCRMGWGCWPCSGFLSRRE